MAPKKYGRGSKRAKKDEAALTAQQEARETTEAEEDQAQEQENSQDEPAGEFVVTYRQQMRASRSPEGIIAAWVTERSWRGAFLGAPRECSLAQQASHQRRQRTPAVSVSAGEENGKATAANGGREAADVAKEDDGKAEDDANAEDAAAKVSYRY